MIFFLLLALEAFAIPKFEVWFLSEDERYSIVEKTRFHSYASAEVSHKECRNLGHQFFHPQLGIHDHSKFNMTPIQASPTVTRKDLPLLNMSSQLVSCDKNNYFDLFCGKDKTEGKGTQIWIDTSSSLRGIDWQENYVCFRAQFVEKVFKSCKLKPKLSTFDTVLNPTHHRNSRILCQTYGMNNLEKLKNWIVNSTAKKLIIITDISELNENFAKFIDLNDGIMRGADFEPLLAHDLLKLVSDVCP